MTEEESKVRLKEQLNVAHTLRNAQRSGGGPRKEDIEKIQSIAQV